MWLHSLIPIQGPAMSVAFLANVPIKTNAMTPEEGSSAAVFVLAVGLEGTGHDLLSHLYELSPSSQLLLRHNITQDILNIRSSLYNHRAREKALFSGPSSEKRAPNGTEIMGNLVRNLQNVNHLVHSLNQDLPLSVFLNSLHGDSYGSIAGMMSYPNFPGPSKALQYPDLISFYKACDLANVTCKHILSYRNPYEVIRSTTMNREFGKKYLQIHLYSTMLDILYVQLFEFPNHLGACFEYGNRHAGANVALGKGLGWDDANQSFREIFDTHFRPTSKQLSEQDRADIIPSYLQVYMDRMVIASRRLEELCLEQLQQSI